MGSIIQFRRTVAVVSPVEIALRLVRTRLVHVGLRHHEASERVVLEVDARAVLVAFGVGVWTASICVICEAPCTIFVTLDQGERLICQNFTGNAQFNVRLAMGIEEPRGIS